MTSIDQKVAEMRERMLHARSVLLELRKLGAMIAVLTSIEQRNDEPIDYWLGKYRDVLERFPARGGLRRRSGGVVGAQRPRGQRGHAPLGAIRRNHREDPDA